jgi:hypothetical protein
MAYESTLVAVAKSQEAIRRIIYAHKGTGLNLMSQPPREGFEALVTIEKLPYHIRIMATCKDVNDYRRPGYRRRASGAVEKDREQEERRVWRVLYWHLKAMFEAADSGVIDIRDVILPYVVTRDGRTLSEHLTPRMEEIMTVDARKLLPVGSE